MSEPETGRQRFIRNGQENARIVRANALRVAREGDQTTADKMNAIQDKWDDLLAEAQRQEDAGSTATGPE